MHKVKCSICGENFDRDIVPTVKDPKNKRRYCHQKCYPEGELIPVISENEKGIRKPISTDKDKPSDLILLEEYICKLYNDDWVYPNIKKQIKEYVNENHFTYMGILWSLKWWYEVTQHKVNKKQITIGIVPHIYKQANEYYTKLARVSSQTVQLKNESAIENIVINKVDRSKKVKLFNMEE